MVAAYSIIQKSFRKTNDLKILWRMFGNIHESADNIISHTCRIYIKYINAVKNIYRHKIEKIIADSIGYNLVIFIRPWNKTVIDKK